MIPLKRMGQADRVAGLVSYLMSDITRLRHPPRSSRSAEAWYEGT